MAGEAKLGMLIGVVVVLAVAFTYFRPEERSAAASEKAKTAQHSRAVSLSPMRPADTATSEE